MPHNWYRSRLATALAVALVGCADPTSVSERAQEAYRGPLVFRVQEELASEAPGLPVITLRLKPIAYGASFEGDYSIEGSTVTVRAVRVTEELGCYLPCVGMGLQPPIIVPLPRREGEYTLRFLAAGTTVEYGLRVERDRLLLEPAELGLLRTVFPPVVTPEFTTVGRIPENWFYLNCFDAGRTQCVGLLDRLIRETGVEQVTFPEGLSLTHEQTYLRYRDEAAFARIVEITCAAVLAQSGYMILNVASWLGVARQAYRLPDGSTSCHAIPASLVSHTPEPTR